MTALLDAARQALEALEKCAMTIDWEWGDCRELEEMRQTGQYTDETTPAITALRQAIEQVEKQEPIGYVNPRWALEMQQKRLPHTWLHAQRDVEASVAVYIIQPQPKQEPVAWGIANTRPTESKPLMMVMLDEPPPSHLVIPLYTAPPQRKPLTAEEMPLLFVDGLALNAEATERVVRAVEKAHGIGGGE